MWLYGDFTNAGYLALAMGISNFFFCVATYNMRPYQVSDVHDEYSDSVYVVSRVVTCLAALVLCVAFVLISGYSVYQVLIIVIYMVFRLIEAFSDILHGIVHKHMRLDYAAKAMIARGLLTLATFWILGSMFDLLPAIIGMTVISAFSLVVYDWIRAKRYAAFTKFAYADVWRLLKRCFPLMIVVLVYSLFAAYVRYSLERIHGTEALGAYASAVTPAIAVQMVVGFAFAPLVSVFSACMKDSDKARFKRVFAISCAFVAGVALVAYLAAYFAGAWGLQLMFGAEILPYTYLLPGAVMAAGVMASLCFMNVVMSTVRDIKGLFIGSIAGAVACMAATDFFLGVFGLAGANYALLFCQGVMAVVLFVRFFYNFKNIEGMQEKLS